MQRKKKKTAGEEEGNKKIESVPRRSSRAYPPLTRRASPSLLSFSHFPQGYFLVNLSTKSSIRDPIVLDNQIMRVREDMWPERKKVLKGRGTSLNAIPVKQGANNCWAALGLD
uniref:Uncharacterized protein n=1 Tax=Vespula pensylvanica TaxID=30213 RepID=A0A834NXS4_VESPE|nr:hypothetical protein H0235_010793 [Vespula pensylvanica]